MKLKNNTKIILIIAAIALILTGCMAGVLINNLNKLQLKSGDEGHLLCVTIPKEKIESFDELPLSYIFLPSYVSSNYLIVDSSLANMRVNGEKLGKIWHFQYDAAYDIVLEQNGEFIEKQLMFKHSSNVHSMFIDTQSGRLDFIWDNKENKEAAYTRIYDAKGHEVHQGELEYMKGRGNSTWSTFVKKPYAIKFVKKVALLGMHEQKKYVLLANAFDRSGISNGIALQMGQALGLTETPRGDYVDLYLNGNYVGNYLLCEPVSEKLLGIDSDKVDVTKQYIVEKDLYYSLEPYHFVTKAGNAFSMKEPEQLEKEELANIQEQIQAIEDGILANDSQIFELLDLDTLVKRYLLDRILGNVDIAVSSTFFYKKEGDAKLYSGPLWDYDRCFGLMGWHVCTPETEMEEVRTEVLTWYAQLEQNPEFVARCAAIYQESVRPYVVELLRTGLNQEVRRLTSTMNMNHAVSYELRSYYVGWDANIKYIKYYLTNRVNFYDKKYGIAAAPLVFGGDGTTHTIAVLYEDDTYFYTVEDGQCFDIPVEFDEDEYDYWRFYENDVMYESKVPIFEDKIIVAHRKYAGD